ncbi:hypothetical protein BKA57DRAFT_27116 [Linnemannia elongata]|nr:hypothetical protein BKA57DRAFT_27116 [Linnemannia elongata]
MSLVLCFVSFLKGGQEAPPTNDPTLLPQQTVGQLSLYCYVLEYATLLQFLAMLLLFPNDESSFCRVSSKRVCFFFSVVVVLSCCLLFVICYLLLLLIFQSAALLLHLMDG